MRSMPVGSWGDDDGSRDRAPYFERHPGVWTPGDWITLFPDGASVITGRSDATLTGADPDTAASRGSLANREVLDAHTGLAE